MVQRDVSHIVKMINSVQKSISKFNSGTVSFFLFNINIYFFCKNVLIGFCDFGGGLLIALGC